MMVSLEYNNIMRWGHKFTKKETHKFTSLKSWKKKIVRGEDHIPSWAQKLADIPHDDIIHQKLPLTSKCEQREVRGFTITF